MKSSPAFYMVFLCIYSSQDAPDCKIRGSGGRQIIDESLHDSIADIRTDPQKMDAKCPEKLYCRDDGQSSSQSPYGIIAGQGSANIRKEQIEKKHG